MFEVGFPFEKMFEVFRWLTGVGYWGKMWLQGGCVSFEYSMFGSGDVNPGVDPRNLNSCGGR
jgi:hypothetical protein